MSVRAQTLVWDIDIPTNRKFVLVKMADHADDEGGNIFPAVETVALKCGMSERTVKRVLKDFRDEGVLVLVREGRRGYGGSRGRGRTYKIDFDVAISRYGLVKTGTDSSGEECDDGGDLGVTWCHPKDEFRGDSVSPLKPPGVTQVTPQEPLGVTNGARRGDRAVSPKPSGTDEEEEENARGSSSDEKFDQIKRAEAVHERCLQIIGVDRSSPGMSLHRSALKWLEAGCDPDEDIYPAVLETCNWLKSKSRPPPKSMSYFDDPVLKARDERLSFNQENQADQEDGSKNQTTRSEPDQGLIQRIAARHRRES